MSEYPKECELKWYWANLVKKYYKETNIESKIPKSMGTMRFMVFSEVESFAEWLQNNGCLMQLNQDQPKISPSMEGHASEAIKFCQDRKITDLKVKFIKTKGWNVNPKYCCVKHQPSQILIEEQTTKEKEGLP